MEFDIDIVMAVQDQDSVRLDGLCSVLLHLRFVSVRIFLYSSRERIAVHMCHERSQSTCVEVHTTEHTSPHLMFAQHIAEWYDRMSTWILFMHDHYSTDSVRIMLRNITSCFIQCSIACDPLHFSHKWPYSVPIDEWCAPGAGVSLAYWAGVHLPRDMAECFLSGNLPTNHTPMFATHSKNLHSLERYTWGNIVYDMRLDDSLAHYMQHMWIPICLM